MLKRQTEMLLAKESSYLKEGCQKLNSCLEIHQMTETGKCSVLQVRKSSENTNMKCTTSKKETKEKNITVRKRSQKIVVCSAYGHAARHFKLRKYDKRAPINEWKLTKSCKYTFTIMCDFKMGKQKELVWEYQCVIGWTGGGRHRKWEVSAEE